MRRAVAAWMLALTLPLGAWAQGDTKVPTSFEVISIRPVPPDSMGTISEPAGTEFRAHAMELSVLVQMAFGINPNQMVIPDWAQSVKFDIAAKTGSAVPLTYQQMKPLLQKMLADRFGMTSHRETREVQGYEMVPAKDGLKLTPAKPGSSRGGNGAPGAIDMPNTTMKSFAGMLTARLKRPVSDKTGADGEYEVKLRFAPDGDAESTLPSIFTALQEEMGIKLKPAKVPVEMVVIDQLNKTPTEN
jgi:uncharacterized protein (TIGR03435 family)